MATKLAEKLKALDFAVFEKMGLVGWKGADGRTVCGRCDRVARARGPVLS